MKQNLRVLNGDEKKTVFPGAARWWMIEWHLGDKIQEFSFSDTCWPSSTVFRALLRCRRFRMYPKRRRNAVSFSRACFFAFSSGIFARFSRAFANGASAPKTKNQQNLLVNNNFEFFQIYLFSFVTKQNTNHLRISDSYLRCQLSGEKIHDHHSRSSAFVFPITSQLPSLAQLVFWNYTGKICHLLKSIESQWARKKNCHSKIQPPQNSKV